MLKDPIACFDEWLKQVYVWPDDVPTDCTRLDENETDCLERGDLHTCASCAEYDKACQDYEKDREEAEKEI